MGFLDKVEKSIEGAVSGVFARAFRGEVEPVEIAGRLQRELDSEAQILSRDKSLVPNDFVVRLSSRDYERLVPYTKTLNAEIIPTLRDHASERHYVFNGPIHIRYDLDDALPVGKFTVLTGENHAKAVSDRRAPLVLEVDGVRHPLTPPGLTIGRGSDADIRINDPGISRLHARINVWPQGNGIGLSIEDLDSTNGVTVNGVKVTSTELGDGSRIEIGSTRMLVHSRRGSDRERISRHTITHRLSGDIVDLHPVCHECHSYRYLRPPGPSQCWRSRRGIRTTQ
ncbi:adenylate cyclase [Cutibacterium acnes JCM 18920]|nr:adenylate cyclase [Cutibacterium acnes JCM 18920]